MDNPIVSQLHTLDFRNEFSLAYLAGVVDSDGTIGISRSRSRGSRRGYRYICYVEIGQYRNDGLFSFLMERFQGGISRPSKSVPRWRAYGLSAVPFLKSICPYLILKRDEAESVLKCLSFARIGKNTLNDEEDRMQQACYDEAGQAKTRRYGIHGSKVTIERFDLDYVGGVVDSEGSFGIRRIMGRADYLHTFSFTLMQHRHDNLYEWLVREFGGTYTSGQGKRTIPCWRIHGRASRDFLEAISPHLRLKSADAAISLALLDTVVDGGIQLPKSVRQMQAGFYFDITGSRDARKQDSA